MNRVKLNQLQKKELIIAGSFFALAVALGAFGAHGLEKSLSEKAIATYKTGVQYQFYHAIALFITSFSASLYQLRLHKTFWAFVCGIILFSFNCYLYAITGIKMFALIVPAGGVLFLIGWILYIKTLIQSENI